MLGSGSSGNCTLVEGRRGRLLIDCGLSARETERRLEQVGTDPRSIDAVLVSHEHADHVGGAARFSRRFGAPVHTTPATAAASGLAAADLAGLSHTEPGLSFMVGDIAVSPFSVPHDAVDNVGFVVECEGTRLGYATDLGHTTRLVVERLKQCDLLVTEANHDSEMLRSGPYPWSVKQRILGRHGHLSNDEMSDLVAGVAGERTRHLFLAHLSRTNNTPDLAMQACRRGLESAGRSRVKIHVTHQREISEVVEA
ncbi:MAG TPA: MBL fold metallo-hydrolase [Patescibacteria group bacterium]|nr:MBL fold metallo-hydrolase [Patescibacteria group bacterium]